MARLNLSKIAKREVTLSQLMTDRELIDNEDIIKYYPNGITIYAAEEIQISDSRYYVYLIKEENKKFAASGLILTKIFDKILEACGGDVEIFNEELAQGLSVKLIADKTKDKKPIYRIEVL